MKNQDALVKRVTLSMWNEAKIKNGLWTWKDLARAAIKAMPQNRDTERLTWVLKHINLNLGVTVQTRKDIDREMREERRK